MQKENDFDYLGRQLWVSCFGFYGGYLKSGSVRSLGIFSSSLGSMMKLIQFGNFGWKLVEGRTLGLRTRASCVPKA